MPQLTDDELHALAYYAIGVASEGKDEAYQLSFAGHITRGKDGAAQLTPIGNSGYTLGEMQTDLGQHPDAAGALVVGFQSWARANHPEWELTADEQAALVAQVSRDGHHIRDPEYTRDNRAYVAQHGTSMPSRLLPVSGQGIDTATHPDIKAHLDVYLRSPAGKAFVDAQDRQRVDGLVANVAKGLADKNLYRDASPDEQAKLFAVTAKVYNQSPKLAKEILDAIDHHHITSLAGISTKIDAFPEYMRTGRDAALAGADVFIALQTAEENNPLHGAWHDAIAAPIAATTQPAGSAPAAEHAAVKALFVQQAEGWHLIDVLEAGGAYSYGDPAHAHSRGFYAEGRDFLLWDRNGQGSGRIDGQWMTFARDDIVLHHNADESLDVDHVCAGHTERLLHLNHSAQHHHAPKPRNDGALLRSDSRGDAVTQLQTELVQLGYTDRRGRALHADGDFGANTRFAVESFQRDHHLVIDGRAGSHTQSALSAALDAAHEAVAAHALAHETPFAFGDPSHPQHRLYTALQRALPQGTSEARLAQATAECRLAGINKPEDLSGIYSGGTGKVFFASESLFADMATLDITRPAPAVQHSLEQVRQFDQLQQMQPTMRQQPAQGLGTQH